MLTDSKILHWTVFAFSLLLALSCIIFWFASKTYWIDGFFRMLFIVVACVFIACSPFNWMKFLTEKFAFLSTRFWRSGFIILISLFPFPCFNKYCWVGTLSFQNAASLCLFIVGFVQLGLEVFDFQKDKNVQVVHVKTEQKITYTSSLPK
ncbi:Hypothetical_protein [Hexamita inflata]|uniref:Hypothetical_protein n=1 Tax=Hexamita inflata TaxID=28002 RepID=A0AA86PMZ1_9EUKA|nr:Hypothetical protein HINF_LOCUS26050 [Hexamita inflata]